MFSLDAFDGNAPFLDKLAGFLIHMLPSFVMILFLVISWNRPVAAGFMFILLGMLFTFFFNTYKEVASFLTISLIPILTGLMFLVPSMIRRKTSSAS
jgi:general stress protein CsbA